MSTPRSSDSVDSYYQEIGRAGRDGEPARAVLFYRPEDVGLRRFFAGAGRCGPTRCSRCAEAVPAGHAPVEPAELRDATELSETKVDAALGRLEEVGCRRGACRTGASQPRRRRSTSREAATEAARRRRSDRKEYDRTRVEMMRGYAETQDCRRAYILSYFGEALRGAVRQLRQLRRRATASPEPAMGEPFAVATRVTHGEWGDGTIQRYEEDAMVVLFDEGGYRTLSVALVEERGLLTAV